MNADASASVVHDDIKQKGVEGEPLRKSLEGGRVGRVSLRWNMAEPSRLWDCDRHVASFLVLLKHKVDVVRPQLRHVGS